MNTNYERVVKKVLMGILQYSLDHRTNIPELYKRAKESLRKQDGSNGGYSHKQIDDLTKKLLLSDNAFIEKLRRGYNEVGDIKNGSYGTVYRILKRIHFKIVDFEWSSDVLPEKLFVPADSWIGEGKVSNGCKRGRLSHGQINRKSIY